MPSRRENKSLTKTQQRKKEHLELCLDTKTISGPTGSGLASYTFVHNALPDLDIDEIDIETTFLGKRLKAPILISSMTGGFSLARTVNRNLAAPRDARLWEELKREIVAVPLAPLEVGFCSAGLYLVSLKRLAGSEESIGGAVLLPAVIDYPKDKIEIVSQVRVKDALSVKDGDSLVLEFDD